MDSKDIIEPLLPWQLVIGEPIREALVQWDGTVGANYGIYGIMMNSSCTLNLSSPDQPYQKNRKSSEARPSNDLEKIAVRKSYYIGKSIINLIYFHCTNAHGEVTHCHYFAVLEDGSYLTTYPAFNYTAFAYSAFRKWEDDMESNHALESVKLRRKEFYNAWNHTRIDPFVVYR